MTPTAVIRWACLLLLLVQWSDAFSTTSTKRAIGSGSSLRKFSSPLATDTPTALWLASSAANSEGSWGVDKLLRSRAKRQGQKQEQFTPIEKRQILKDYKVASVKDVLKFAIPAVGVWLCVPLLSMIDTSAVGLIAGTASQAALNPAISVIQYSSKLMTFLFSGTTTMMAAAAAIDRRDKKSTEDGLTDTNTQQTSRTMTTLVGALQLSTLVGAGLGATVFLFARQLLGAIVGAGSAVDPTIALRYIQIRALGLAGAAMLGSAQTACLAQGDVRMPLYATIIAACSNLVLDVILIRNPHAWIGGTAGAAWATTISQYIAAGWCVRWLLAKPKPKRGNAQFNLEHQEQSTGGFVCKSTRGFLTGRMRLRDWVKLPSKSIVDGFAPFVIPVITTQAGRMSASATMDHVISSSLSTASVAANQILTSVYYGLVPVAESLSLAAQNFVPGIMERDDSGGQKAGVQAFAMRQLLKSFLKAAGLCGLVLAAIMGTLPLYAGVFTLDLSVRSLVTAVVPFLFVTCLKHGLFCASEGVLLGQKDLKFLGSQYAVYTFLIPYLLLQLKKAALAGSTKVTLVSVWQLFWAYDLFRTVLMVGRIMWLERKRGDSSAAQP